MKKFCKVFVSAAFVTCLATSLRAQTVTVNLIDYIYQTTDGNMICQSDGRLCLKGFYASDGGFIINYTNGITDFIARSTSSPYYVGVMRNAPDFNPANFRCFSNVDASPCTAPPNATFPPQSVPQIVNLNVVSASTAAAAENSDGTPNGPIAGSSQVTGSQPVNFGIYHMDPSTCAQTYIGNVLHTVLMVFVNQKNFNGNLGVRNAVVIDEYEGGPTPDQNHVERYYYVAGIGRVQESSSYYNPSTGKFDRPLGGVSLRNMIVQSNMPQPATICAQGSQPLQ